MLREVKKVEMPGGRVLTIFFMKHLQHYVGFPPPYASSPSMGNIGRCLKVIKFQLYLYCEVEEGVGKGYSIKRMPYFYCFLINLIKTRGDMNPLTECSALF